MIEAGPSCYRSCYPQPGGYYKADGEAARGLWSVEPKKQSSKGVEIPKGGGQAKAEDAAGSLANI